MKASKKILLFLMAALMVLTMTACGQKALVTIIDDGTPTEIEVTLPRTVTKILNAAGIQLGENDVVTPSADTKLQEPEEIKIEREHKVTLVVDGENKEESIVGGTVADLLKAAGVTLTESQKVDVPLEEALTDGMKVQVINLTKISLTCDGETTTPFVEGPTVNDALTELGITLGAEDAVAPEKDTEIAEGMEIVVDRVKVEEVTEKEEIPYEVEYQYDNSKPKGQETTSVAGENGEKEVTYKITYKNGEEIDREVVKENVTKEPVTAVVIVGTYVAPSSSGSSDSSDSSSGGGRTVVSKTPVYNCSGDGHGYYVIVYSDGSEEYEEF